MRTFIQQVPDGINIQKASSGYGLFASKLFLKGTVLYMGKQIEIPNTHNSFNLITNQGTFLLDTETHSVQFSPHLRWLYLFDSFMNHSCQPTTISHQTNEQRERGEYSTIALQDIHPGQEITCDYNLFEYDCQGKTINVCMCETEKCIGYVRGFKYLPKEYQKECIQYVENEVLQSMTENNSNFHYISRLDCPSTVSIIYDKGCYKLVALQDFSTHDVIYTNTSLLLPKEVEIVVCIENEYDEYKKIWLSHEHHTVTRDNGIEYFGFDTFQNHSCDPNTTMTYLDTNYTYNVIAKKNIIKGDELTIDYSTFAPRTYIPFECHCQSNHCKGLIFY